MAMAGVSRYEEIKKLGAGSYGEVFQARDKQTGRLVAIKKSERLADDGVPHTTVRELAQLRYLGDSAYVVSLLDVYLGRDSTGRDMIFMVFECLDMDLLSYIHRFRVRREKMPPRLIKNFSYQLLKSMAFLHSRGIIHRDIKSQNVLMDLDKGLLKMGDLGFARSMSIPAMLYTPRVATVWYRAPELFLGIDVYLFAIDMWSIGCIIAEFITQVPIWKTECELHQLYEIFRVFGTPTEDEWPGVTGLAFWHAFPKFKANGLQMYLPGADPQYVDLLYKMFAYDPAKRISAKDALHHPYFDDVDDTQY